MRWLRYLVLLILTLAALGGVYLVKRQSPGLAEETKPMAPELSGAVAWINTDHPITIAELRGRVVILDFWTYGCINCMHVLPVLRRLEEAREGQPFEVIGVHSAKFENEKAPARVRSAVERYGITHPVAVDSELAIWDHYGVQAWPTLVVIRPDGRVAGTIPGEVSFEQIDKLVQDLLDEAKARGKLANGPALPHRPQNLAASELAYPGRVIAAADGRLFISDSRHHRVLITAPDGRILDQIGSGSQGRKDGSFETAQLDDPQGMALAGKTLYLADARGYAVLAIDLEARRVTAVAGTGRLGQQPLGAPTKASTLDLRSPWDVALKDGKLWVAMAGSHQIGIIDLDRGTIARYAGSGREDIQDGPPEDAAFAQPSGLSFSGDGQTLFVADSESSGVRAIELKTAKTRTLLGTGLFDWGDGEGSLRPKLIQHPLAIAASTEGLWVADSYNGKVKLLAGSGGGPSGPFTLLTTKITQAGGKPLSDPGGLSIDADGSLLIADTGNDRILRLPPGAREPLVVAIGKREASAQTLGVVGRAREDRTPEVELAARALPPGPQPLHFELVAPAGFVFSTGAPWSLSLEVTGALSLGESSLAGEAKAGQRIAASTEANLSGKGKLTARVHANICDAIDHAACYPMRARFAVSISAGAKASEGSEKPIALVLAAPAHPLAKP